MVEEKQSLHEHPRMPQIPNLKVFWILVVDQDITLFCCQCHFQMWRLLELILEFPCCVTVTLGKNIKNCPTIRHCNKTPKATVQWKKLLRNQRGGSCKDFINKKCQFLLIGIFYGFNSVEAISIRPKVMNVGKCYSPLQIQN